LFASQQISYHLLLSVSSELLALGTEEFSREFIYVLLVPLSGIKATLSSL